LFEHQTQSNQLIASPSQQALALHVSHSHALHAVPLSPTAVPFMSSARTIVPIKPVIPRMFAPSPVLMSSAADKAATPVAELSTRSLHSSAGQSLPSAAPLQSVSPALTPSSLAAAIPISVSVTPLVAPAPASGAAPAVGSITPSKLSSRTAVATPVPQVAEVTEKQPADSAPAISRTVTPALVPVDEAVVPKPESPTALVDTPDSHETAGSITPAVSSTLVAESTEAASQPLVQPEADNSILELSNVNNERSESRLQTPVPVPDSGRRSARLQPVTSELPMTDVPQDQSTVTDVVHESVIDAEAPVVSQSAIEAEQPLINAAADAQTTSASVTHSDTHSARSMSIQPDKGDGSSVSHRSLASVSSGTPALAASVTVQTAPVEPIKAVPLPPLPEPIPLAVVCRCDSFDTPLEVSGGANLADGRLVVETPVFMRVCYTCTVARVLDNWPSDLFQQIMRFV
jgi:hypothetical protein